MNKTLVLAAVLFALVGIYWVMNQSEPVGKTDIPLVQADSASVTAMKIITASDTTELRKEGDGWKIMGARVFPANPQNIGRALQRFSQMTKKAMVTDKPDRYGEFEVDGVKGVLVNFTANGKDQSLFLGKAGPTMQTSYARVEGDKEVWEIGGNHASAFRRPPADWRDKTITALPMDSIRKVFDYARWSNAVLKSRTLLGMRPRTARTVSGDQAECRACDQITFTMSAVEFADTLTDATFATPKGVITVEMMDGSRTELLLAPRDDKQYYVRKTGALSDFVIYNSTADVLLKKKDDLIEKAKPAG